MPLYEYRCSVCRYKTERVRPVSEYKERLVIPCHDRSNVECQLDRILSPTPTTFVFADRRR